ncbi:hypothetical protein BC938DRAFT_473939 [Jimgerdemannia flammicorona]|uniref:PARP catalytic domain-containing protein n=1 Tax=Jimgerdemannia flammicorona TaxID=994334 RepID=A0A433QSZ6_9FUNG|nr:hypothetical protein BC938DRAFT_473939 [Jimgerdemannia flammicorona]
MQLLPNSSACIPKKSAFLPNSSGAKPLQDENTLSTYHIGHESTVHAVPSIVGGGPGIPIVYYLSADFLHPRFDYDFTDLKDNADGNHRRGGYTYRRPCGWHRYGIRVNGKYGDDRWLGSNPDSDEVWPVSYHGTTKEAAASITNTGYDVSKGNRFRFGKGIYSTPLVTEASNYATLFVYNGVKYKMVLQNRVNSKGMTVNRLPERPEIEYWVSLSDRDTRPYGVLIRRA